MAKPVKARLRELGQRINGIPAAAAAPIPVRPGPGISRARGQTGQPGRRGVAGVLGLGALMSVAGGLAPQRPDQALESSSAGVAPGTATGTLRAILAIIGGAGPGVTGVFVYSGLPGASDLIASMTNSPKDPFGTTTYRSVAAYQSGTPRVAAQLSAGAVIFNRGAAVIFSPAVVGSNDAAPLVAASGQVNASDVQCSLVLVPALAGGVPLAELVGALELFESAAPPAASGVTAGPQLFGTTGGHAAVVDDALNGDGVTYQIGQRDQFNTSAVAIPASGFTAVLSQAVAIGSYHFEGIMRLKQGVTASIPGNIGFTGPATSFSTWYAFWSLQGATTTFNSTPVLTLGSQLNVLGSQAIAGDEVVCWYRGDVTFTAKGTFTAGCQADGTHPFTAQPGCELSMRRTG